jgi:arginyl-tRNA synthetase
MIKKQLLESVQSAITISLRDMGVEKPELQMEIPPSKNLGDYAFPMFRFAKELKMNPAEIAQQTGESLEKVDIVEKVEIKGAYLNVFLNRGTVVGRLIPEILEKRGDYGKNKEKKDTIVIEFSSPNTNKPLHLGHCRNNALGDSMARILRFCGHPVITVNLVNDRGVHICKSMLAYDRFGNGVTPESTGKKSDHMVGDFYVTFAREAEKNPKLEEEAQAMLRLWEEKDPHTRELWEKMNKWTIDGIKQTYDRMGIKFDSFEFESVKLPVWKRCNPGRA